jgi:hypothetical protein
MSHLIAPCSFERLIVLPRRLRKLHLLRRDHLPPALLVSTGAIRPSFRANCAAANRLLCGCADSHSLRVVQDAILLRRSTCNGNAVVNSSDVSASKSGEPIVVKDRAVQCLGVLAMLVVASAVTSPAAADEKLSAFMKAKLGHAEKVLEGLTREDFDVIAKNSQAMSLLCEDEMWMVVQTAEYRERSTEFRRSVDAITEAARKKNLEGAAFAYLDSTMKCVSCHKYVRKSRAGQ